MRYVIDIGNLKYVAGLYEGEGWCGRYKEPGKSERFHLEIEMADLSPLSMVKSIMGFGVIYGPRDRPNSKKPRYRYFVYGFEKVQAFLVMIWCWLSPRRQEQACDCLDKEYLNEYD